MAIVALFSLLASCRTLHVAWKRAPQSWSDIPLELAGLVLCRLPAHVDRVRFAAVCPQWRVAAREVPLSPPLPLLALPDGTVYSLPKSEPFSLPACAGYTDACSNWLLFSQEDGCFLRDPFSNATVTLTLPPLSQVRVRYVGDELGSGSTMSPNLIAASIWFQESSQIAVCQPGATSWWSMMHLDVHPIFCDLTFHQGKLYALDHHQGDLFSVDTSIDHNTGDPWISQIWRVISGVFDQFITATPSYGVLKMLYLAELHGRLLIVRRSMNRRFKASLTLELAARSWMNEFEVFEGDFEQSQWSRVTTIGDDQVLFLERGCCKFVCVSQYKMQGDRIFLLEDGDDDDLENGDDDDLGNGDGDGSQYYEERLGPCKVFNIRDSKVSDPLPTVSWKHSPARATWLFPPGQE
ncbi:hypothetical protein PR202_ga22412 [Eleusine coracana subsp. coracana]|uniref:KIB1-4 beta-propeller domain-containing protein n=1 Tax=Eleusine coracana subsp. coracana TaxID=191504 RepID=A0AAV5D3U8_ELECO|nr:hypothetical protein PR202_ga22412 [Eleusine coracana subsp. coracana]